MTVDEMMDSYIDSEIGFIGWFREWFIDKGILS
jgi:hypothetical protein